MDSYGRDRSRSNPSTAPGSPAESDDEEEADVDYDDVLAIIDTRKNLGSSPSSPRGKKKGGKSYQDLTNLREGRSPRTDTGVPLPAVKGEEDMTRLRMRKDASKTVNGGQENGQDGAQRRGKHD